MKGWLNGVAVIGTATVTMVAVAAWTSPASTAYAKDQSKADQVAHGRFLVISHDCGGCHGGGSDPAAKGWLAGVMSPEMEFKIGPCALDPNAKPCFITRPKNLTPDNATGTGRFTERQIFNALRFGLRPEETPDVEIWQIENVVGMDHPFHLHGFQFQVIDRDGVSEPFRSWKDTVNVPKHSMVRIVVRFADYAGKWMYHCHILDHEDHGMMGVLEVN